MNKTAISILQEAMAIKHKSAPRYLEDLCDLPEFRFKYLVNVEDITAAGYGNTKQGAKQNSAAQALKKLGYINEITNSDDKNNKDANFPISIQLTPSKAFVNYVGKLNEFASINTKPYAMYVDEIMLNMGQFVVKCNFLEWMTKGAATTRKGAKQESAKNMLELLKTKNVSLMEVTTQHLDRSQMDNMNKLTEEVIRRFEKMPSISKIKEISADCSEVSVFTGRLDSVEVLMKVLMQRGHRCSLTTVQSNPIVLMLKLQDSECVIMGCGDTKEIALQDLLQMASLMISNGYSFCLH